ncbi:MAG: MFS transporter [Chloroflexi bacterium]|nr:MFS transporter [Chloroflexota bacterium]
MKTKPSPSMSSFWLLWSGQAISLFGSQLVQFALIWWLTQKTGSGTVLSTAVLVGIVPQVVLGPIIGALVDRWNRQRILFMADTAVAFASLFLAVLFGLGIAEIWHVFAILFVRALGGAFHGPTMMTSTALMVPPDQLTRIQGVNQTLQAGLTVVSAPLGALLLGGIGVVGMLVLDAVTAVFAILPLFFIAIPQPPKEPIQDKKPSLWREIGAGMRYVWIRPGLLGLIGMAALINFLLMPAMSLVPLLVQTHFNGGAMQYAILESMIGLGALVGGVSLGVWGGFRRRIYTVLVGIGGIGVGVLVLAVAPSHLFIMGVAGMTFTGVMMVWANGSLAAIMQATVEPSYQGRVFTLLGTLATAMAPIGLIIAGPVADLWGVHFWLVTGGLMCLGMAAVGFASTHVRNVEQVGVEVETAVAL